MFWITKRSFPLMLFALLVTATVMAPTLTNGWVNWDDEAFVLNNPVVTTLSLENTKEVFTRIDDNGGYTPLVLLSWSANYTVGGFDASAFHSTNLLLHLINVGLVFFLLFWLTGRKEVSVITAILFGIHPTQLEPVAWITARKDLLYGMFYLAGLLAYLKYVDEKTRMSKTWFAATLILFVCSLLSKGMAVTFPIILFLIDYFKGRKNVLKCGLEKVPFLMLSVAFGVIASVGQTEVGAVDDAQNISFFQSFFVACYSLTTYVFKAVIPVNLSAYHPYPFTPSQSIPWFVYAAVVPTGVVVSGTLLSLWKNRNIAFGLMFFLVSVALVLQFFPVGIAIVAERFTYLANIGLFFLLALGTTSLASRFTENKKYVYAGAASYILALSILTFGRTGVWQDSETLWSDVIEKYPTDFLAYNNRASYYSSLNQTDLAIRDYSSALLFHQSSVQSYHDRGILYLRTGDFSNALSDFSSVVSLDSKSGLGFLNRGLVFMNLNRMEEAYNDFSRCIELVPNWPLAHFNRGLLFSQVERFDAALEDLSIAIEQEPNNYNFRIVRAQVLVKLGNVEAAIKEYETCISLNPTNARPHFEVGQIFLEANEHNLAIQAFNTSISLDKNLVGAYINLGLIYLNKNEFEKAENALNRAVFLAPNSHLGLFNRGLVYNQTNRLEKAIADFSSCIVINADYAPAYYWRSRAYQTLGNNKNALQDAAKAKRLGYQVESDSLRELP